MLLLIYWNLENLLCSFLCLLWFSSIIGLWLRNLSLFKLNQVQSLFIKYSKFRDTVFSPGRAAQLVRASH